MTRKQKSIEAIGNEAIRYRRKESKQKIFGDEIDAQALAKECIRYMYRVLFMLYIEARPELGYAPMGSEAYRLGYSLERLRELDAMELETPEARDGFTIDLSLKRLFEMVFHGVAPKTARDSTCKSGRSNNGFSHHINAKDQNGWSTSRLISKNTGSVIATHTAKSLNHHACTMVSPRSMASHGRRGRSAIFRSSSCTTASQQQEVAADE